MNNNNQTQKHRCSECRHYKDRYTLFMHGGFRMLRKLLELNLIDERDFICEGWGCVFFPLEDFSVDEHDMPIILTDMPLWECEFFEPKKNREELAKRIWIPKYFPSFGKHKIKHLNISKIQPTAPK